jgi:hypothetical protein
VCSDFIIWNCKKAISSKKDRNYLVFAKSPWEMLLQAIGHSLALLKGYWKDAREMPKGYWIASGQFLRYWKAARKCPNKTNTPRTPVRASWLGVMKNPGNEAISQQETRAELQQLSKKKAISISYL